MIVLEEQKLEKGFKCGFYKNIDSTLLEAINDFYLKQDFIAIEQYPNWALATDSTNSTFFILWKENKIISYAILQEQYKITVSLQFGPVYILPQYGVKALELIHDYYKKSNKVYLRVLLGKFVSSETEYIIYQLKKSLSFDYILTKENKGTSLIDLNDSIENIHKGFNSNTKRALKSFEKAPLTLKKLETSSEIDSFTEGVVKMFKDRGFSKNLASERVKFAQYAHILEKNCLGFFLGIYEQVSLIGGVMIVYQGKTALYHTGFSDIDYKAHPINHIVFYEAIKKAKEDGLSFFDMGGYNHLVTPKDQVHNINVFKDGFTRNYAFYPPVLHIKLHRFPYFIYRKMQLLKGYVANIKSNIKQ